MEITPSIENTITFYAECQKCYSYSKCVIQSKPTSLICLENDSCYVDRYHITNLYYHEMTLITDLKSYKTITLPLMNLNFNDKNVVLNKIKTYLLFS